MSFTNEVKTEMLELWQKKECCRLCEVCGILLFCKKNGKVRMNTSIHDNARHFRSLLRKCFEYQAQIITTASGNYSLTVPDEIVKQVPSDINSIIKCDNCKSAFIRGAFLAVGHLSEPQKEYLAEFIVYGEEASYFLCRALVEFGFDAKTCVKGTRYSVYIKKSSDIEDLLTFMGASNCSLKIMQLQIMRDIRNNVNRKTNFEAANIKKSAQSCAKQLEAIGKLESAGRLDTLPEDLYELAIARKENIDMSLTELGQRFGLSRSGIHHRLQKLIDLSNEIK